MSDQKGDQILMVLVGLAEEMKCLRIALEALAKGQQQTNRLLDTHCTETSQIAQALGSLVEAIDNQQED